LESDSSAAQRSASASGSFLLGTRLGRAYSPEIPIAHDEKVILGHANEPVSGVVTVDSRTPTAAEPALADRSRAASEEVEQLLAAAVRVMARSAPESPKVSDIVIEAGSCNKAFYRYFGGKDDLLLAVMQRGIAIVAAFLEEQMSRELDPAVKVTRWVEGLLAQVTDPHLFSLCAATLAQMSASAHRMASDDEVMQPLRILLTAPIAQLGRADADRDADAVFHCTMGTLRRYVGSELRPPPADVEHLVRFCLSGIGVPAPIAARAG
jgi:AcrR family transcriptional regulator